MPQTSTAPPSSAPLSATELDAWRGMLQVHAKVTAALDAEMQAEHGFPASTYEVLMFLGNAPGHRLRMAEIADRVLLTRSGCTRLVDRLVKLGFVERSSTPEDGRGFFATLTPAGVEKLESARETHYRGVRSQFLAGLSVADQLVLADVWKRALASGD
ncbi:MAG: MarR family transcriptional regulator [Solirubrobacteraceae bacterium]|nr:MarR family transcriptional regulator [Solirubrobacteraceae bacterium]